MKISVVIPSFNAESFIATAIESCLNQDPAPHEVIVVDDASSDRTVEIAKSYPPPVRVICCEQNGGVSVARNRGAEEATGDWIALLDADDWFLPGRFQAQIRCVKQNPEAKVIYSGFRMRELDGRERDSAAFPLDKLGPMMRYRCAFHISTVIMKRDAFRAIGGFDTSLRRSEDYDFWLRLADRFSMSAFASVPEILSVYRLTPGSKSLNTMPFREARYAAIESSGLYGLSGMQRALWRRKVRAFTDYDIAIRLREDGSARDLEFVLHSLLLWPLPSQAIPLKRYLIAAVMLKQHIERRLRK